MGIARTFTKNSAFILATNLVTKAVALFLVVYLAAALGPEGFALYSWVIAIALLLDVLASFGTGNAIAKFLPDALSRNNKPLAGSYFRYLFKVRVIALSAVAVFVLVFAEPIAAFGFGKPLLAGPLRAVVGFLIAYNLTGYLQALFVSLLRNEYAFVSDTVGSVLRVALIVALVAIFGDFYSAVLGYAVSIVVSGIILALIVLVRFPFVFSAGAAPSGKAQPAQKPDIPRVNAYLKYAIVGGFTLVLLTNIDLLMVSALLPVEAIGFYRIALAWASAVLGFIPVYIAFPVLSGLAALPKQHIASGFNSFLKYVSLAAVPGAFLVAYLSRPLVEFFYEPVYGAAIGPLFALASLVALSTLATLFITLYNAVERPDFYTKVFGAGLLLNIALNYYLIASAGLIGAAYATVLTYLFVNAAFALGCPRIAGFRASLSFLLRPLLGSLLMFAALLLLPPAGFIASLAYCALGAALYLLIELAIRGISLQEILHLKGRIFGGS